MTIQAIQCPRCHDLVYSRTKEDKRKCTCEGLGVSGGLDNFFVTWDSDMGRPEDTKAVNVEVNATPQKLHDDWKFNRNNYGIILSKKSKAKTRKHSNSTRKPGLKPGDIFNPAGE